MGRQIGDWDGPGTRFMVSNAFGYVDTMTLLCSRSLPKDLMKWLRRRYGRRLIAQRLTIPKRPGLWYGLVTVHQPDIETLALLTKLLPSPVLHAVHIAVDFFPANVQQTSLATRYLRRGLLLKWRGNGQLSHQYEATTYAKRQPASPRNYALYGDKLSKTGRGPCAHLEFRFRGAAACKRAGVGDLNRLIQGVNLMDLLTRQAKIAFIDRKRLERQIEIYARSTARARQSTVSAERARIKQRFAFMLHEDDNPVDEHTLAKARSQVLWDIRAKQRTCLKVTPWSDFTPPPVWWRW